MEYHANHTDTNDSDRTSFQRNMRQEEEQEANPAFYIDGYKDNPPSYTLSLSQLDSDSSRNFNTGVEVIPMDPYNADGPAESDTAPLIQGQQSERYKPTAPSLDQMMELSSHTSPRKYRFTFMRLLLAVTILVLGVTLVVVIVDFLICYTRCGGEHAMSCDYCPLKLHDGGLALAFLAFTMLSICTILKFIQHCIFQ